MADINLKNKIGTCALCDSADIVLKESHSIPKFVYDWIKNTAKTPYLRNSIDVNKRHQDGPKEYLLCGSCELKLSVLENDIAKNLFKPIANYRKQNKIIEISENIRIGILSILWRALITSIYHENEWIEEDIVKVDELIANLKSDIVNNKSSYKIYFAPFCGKPPYYNLSLDETYNLERAAGSQDIRFIDNPHRFYAVIKLPFMFFYLISDGWPAEEMAKATELKLGSINLESIKEIPNFIHNYILYLAQEFEKTKKSMSEENLAKIAADVRKNKKITGADKSLMRAGRIPIVK